MPLEYKRTFNPGEQMWPVAVKLSQSDVVQRPNTEVVSCKECGEQFGIQNAIAAIRPMQELKERLDQWLARDHTDEKRNHERWAFSVTRPATGLGPQESPSDRGTYRRTCQ
jgi:hypothetical protein